MSEREKIIKTNTMHIIEMNNHLRPLFVICFRLSFFLCEKIVGRFALFPPLVVGVLVVFEAFINHLGSLNIPIDVVFKYGDNDTVEMNGEDKLKPEIANKKRPKDVFLTFVDKYNLVTNEN